MNGSDAGGGEGGEIHRRHDPREGYNEGFNVTPNVGESTNGGCDGTSRALPSRRGREGEASWSEGARERVARGW